VSSVLALHGVDQPPAERNRRNARDGRVAGRVVGVKDEAEKVLGFVAKGCVDLGRAVRRECVLIDEGLSLLGQAKALGTDFGSVGVFGHTKRA